MKPTSRIKLALFSVTALCMATASSSYADPGSQLETGRLQICKNTPSTSDEIEIPADGKYVIAAAKISATEPAIITQTDFSSSLDAAAQGKTNSALTNRFKLENRDGKLFVRVTLAGSRCIYLNATAPVLTNTKLTLSGTHTAPDWVPESDGINVNGVSYRYFGSVDQTYYVASEVGKILSFDVHDMSTGSNLSHDRIRRLPVTNPEVLSLIPNAFKEKLGRLNQFDVNQIDLSKLNISAQGLDLENGSDLNAFVAQIVKAVQPPPHSRLLVALPKKGEVRLKFTNTTLIGNKLEGLGFYRDANLHIIFDSDHSDYVPIDAFINFKTAVIDIDTAKIVATAAYADGRMFFSPPETDSDLAETTKDMDKFRALGRIANMGVENVMNAMFAVK